MEKSSLITRISRWAVGGVIAAAFAVPTAWAETLTVYTAVEAEDLKKYAARFNEDYPDNKIKWVRDSTGIVTAKLLAEKNNPKAEPRKCFSP